MLFSDGLRYSDFFRFGCLRLFAPDFCHVIVDSGFAVIKYHPIKMSSSYRKLTRDCQQNGGRFFALVKPVLHVCEEDMDSTVNVVKF